MELRKNHLILLWMKLVHQQWNFEVQECQYKVKNIILQHKKWFKQAWEMFSIWQTLNLEWNIMHVKTHKIESLITRFLQWLSIRKKVAQIIISMNMLLITKNTLQPNMKSPQIGQIISRDEGNSQRSQRLLCLLESFWKRNEDLSLHHLVINLSSMLELKVPLKVLNILFRKMKNIVSLLTKQNGKEWKQKDMFMRKNIINLIQNQE